jgi:transposase
VRSAAVNDDPRVEDCGAEGSSSNSARRFSSTTGWKVVYQRFNRWAKSGVFERIFKLLASDHDNEYMMIDATIVRAHQHSAGAQKKTASKRLVDPAVG